ncbi:MAG TPA: hypothetical protein VGC58_02655 [Candidatus Paceibacterota bacterium]
MERKKLIWAGMMVGSAVGSFIPMLWGGSMVSMTAFILTAVGGAGGIYLGFKLGE